jgi:hypothetical protein
VTARQSPSSYRTYPFAGGTDPNIRVDPRPATADKNVVNGPAPNNPDDSEQGLAKGGKVRKVVGGKRGKDDGLIAAKRGEFVVRKSSVTKYGAAKMAAVNAGTAKVTIPKRRAGKK